ncbi:cathepsin L-like isoform X2 [Convolutriloba macropyga]|uniref:cathepsin L-like isoform X2 n=1 Tax=Convolutriloba macropyga TaxID=536237 RepID=UPI003F520922
MYRMGKRKSKNFEKELTLEGDFTHEWKMWKKIYKKEYKNLAEETEKYQIWLKNVDFVNRHNLKASLGEKSFTTSLNKYADLSIDDVRKGMNGYKRELKPEWMTSSGAQQFWKPKGLTLPQELDWREWGLVTGVKDQGYCGSCWSFSATGALEGQHYSKTGSLVSLSEQNLMDCSWDYGNMGCNGGYPTEAFKYVKDNGGIDTEASYPYEEQDGDCRFDSDSVGATATGFVTIPKADEDTLKEALAYVGPISVAVDSSHESFQFYEGGVYDEPMCNSIEVDHAVLLVGYGTEDGLEYWLVKNSWGTSWGEQGYIKMARNQNNQCGIATDASYPTV